MVLRNGKSCRALRGQACLAPYVRGFRQALCRRLPRFERKSLAAAGVKDIDLSFWKPHGFLDKLYMLQIGREVAHFYTEQIHVFNWDGDKRSPLKDGIDIWKKYLKIFGGEKTLLLEFMPDDNIRSLPNEAEALRKITEGLI